MDTNKLREKLHKYIDHADKTFLKMVHAMSKEYEQSENVGFTVDGNPITKEDLKKRVKKASERVKSGDYISQDEVDEEVKNW
jgi:predicted Zn-dependent protease